MNGQRLNILLVISALGGGGGGRALATLASRFSRAGHSITVLTWNNFTGMSYDMDPAVRWIDFDRVRQGFGRPLAFAKRLWDVRSVIKRVRPDFIISFVDVTNQAVILANLGLPGKMIASQQCDPRFIPRFGLLWRAASEWLYRRADRVVYLDELQAALAREQSPRWRITHINNPLPEIRIGELTIEDRLLFRGKTIAAMGRLAEQKGFDLLLDAFARVQNDAPDWNLLILGEGPDRVLLEQQVQKLGLGQRVFMPGRHPYPHRVLAHCDMFVVSSRYEGLNMALAEAMACKLPCVSFDCPSGPSLLLKGGEVGCLVPNGDVDELANAMRQLIHDPAQRLELGLKGCNYVHRLLDADHIAGQWQRLFEELRTSDNH